MVFIIVKHNNYAEDKCYFPKEKKKPININEADTKKTVLSNKTPHGKKGANKYYIGYVGSTGVRSLHIINKNIKLYANLVSVLDNDNELLKYIEIWYEIKALLKKINKKGFCIYRMGI